MPPPERLSLIERFYWRTLWLLGARCFGLWLIGDATDKRRLRS